MRGLAAFVQLGVEVRSSVAANLQWTPTPVAGTFGTFSMVP